MSESFMKVYNNLFDKISDPTNLFLAWEEFRRGKGSKEDVRKFELKLEKNIFELARDLKNKKYKHGPYAGFYISDPKLRHIHKATVRDRVLHHAVFQILNPIFEVTFIPNSYSCRIGKGSHKGVADVEKMLLKVSKNHTSSCYVLKCDIKKFFDSVDHGILIGIFQRKIKDLETMQLLREIIGSYSSEHPDLFQPRGLPIGNLTSQLFANVYMNEFDQFMKQELKVKDYARYTDDFIVVFKNKEYLQDLLNPIKEFLNEKLKLGLHPNKIEIRKYGRGIDFLGYVIFPHRIVLRKRSKKRMIRKLKNKISTYKHASITKEKLNRSLQSYLGLLSHADAYKLSRDMQNHYWFWLSE